MKVVVIQFPGSNCDYDTVYTLKQMDDVTVDLLWHKGSNLQNYDLIILPGGFSYGDFLRAGSIASHSPIMKYVKQAAESDIAILGICNGFQILTETGLLPGVLLRNKKLRFISKNVFLKVVNVNSRFCLNYNKKNIITLPIAHNEGNYFANNELLKKLEDKNLIAFKYCNEKGDINETSNPNGSSNNIAGILSSAKNILGMMPHPERLIDPLLSGEDGSIMFESLLKSN